GDNNNWFAAYALWMLELYGVTNTALMDGGRVKWLAEGRVTTTDAPAAGSGSISVADRDESLRAKLPDVLAHVEAGGQLVDVRSPDEFNGVIMAPPGLPETAQRKGHVPGASNIPWATAVAEDGTFKSADELSSIYQAQGITGDQPVIAYCRIGERSSHSWFALRYLLGIDSTSNYDGSWTEYGSVVGVPIDNPSA
ncbi:MAG: sulfurtransferase, partial [Chloroflexi bacterium]|nr:sulfurtransferase [Chloroflexota bacterium]